MTTATPFWSRRAAPPRDFANTDNEVHPISHPRVEVSPCPPCSGACFEIDGHDCPNQHPPLQARRAPRKPIPTVEADRSWRLAQWVIALIGLCVICAVLWGAI